MLITCHNSLGLCQNLSFSLTLCLSPSLSQSIYLSLYISFFLLQSLSAKPTWNFMCQVIERVAVKYPEFVGAVVAVNLAGQVGAACFGIGQFNSTQKLPKNYVVHERRGWRPSRSPPVKVFQNHCRKKSMKTIQHRPLGSNISTPFIIVLKVP